MKLAALAVILAGHSLAQMPSITAVTNAAMPEIDVPADPSIPVQLAPRSLASIYGLNLASGTAAATSGSPWPSSLAGVEVHVAVNPTVYECDPCEVPVGLLYVSAQQINFTVPDTISIAGSSPGFRARIVLIVNGTRYDNHDDVLGGPGLIGVNYSDVHDQTIFEVGYDCLYSYSLINPTACGFSPDDGSYRGPLAAATDANGNVINSSNPITQGESITIWETGLVPLVFNNGLLSEKSPLPVQFGVLSQGYTYPIATLSQPSFAGESPQFEGLDQINLLFPVCNMNGKASSEKRYDLVLEAGSTVTNKIAAVYLPFLVRVGDPDCKLTASSRTTVQTSPNPATVGQTITLTAAVVPTTASGEINFEDGKTHLGTAALVQGKASMSLYGLSTGQHAITAEYSGDRGYDPSTSTAVIETVSNAPPASATVSLRSDFQPPPFSPLYRPDKINLVATVAPAEATGTVDFLDSPPNGCSTGCVYLGSGTLRAGSATAAISTSLLGLDGVGLHYLIALYNGDTSHLQSFSNLLTISGVTATFLVSSANPFSGSGQLILTANVSPPTVTGSVSFLADAGLPIGCTGGTAVLSNGTAQCVATLVVGSHSITAVYDGDTYDLPSASAPMVQIVH